MTPKEKAQELFTKLYFVDDSNGNYPMCRETALGCLYIAVDEIIDTTKNVDFWKQVKNEIQKL